MRTLGPKAMDNRTRCMESVGWMPPGHTYTQDDWLEFITKLNSVSKCTYGQIAVMIGISSQAIQHDFNDFGIKSSIGIGGDHSSTVFLDGDRRKGTIKQHCFRRSLNYNSVYAKMMREMKLNGNLTKQEALIIALGSVKVRQNAKPKAIKEVKPVKVENPEPEREYAWHGKELKDRLSYLAAKAEEHQARPKKKKRQYRENKKREVKPGDTDYSSLIVRDLLLDGYDDKIAVCENKQEPENLPSEEWYR